MLKVGVIILAVMLAYACVYSLMGLIVPKVMLKTSIQASIGKTLDDAQNDGYLKALTASQRTTGVFALATTLSGLFVLIAGFRKGEKWAWWAFLVIGGIAWCGGLIITIVLGDKTNMIMELIGTVIFLVGLLIPVKVFFAAASAASEEPEEV